MAASPGVSSLAAAWWASLPRSWSAARRPFQTAPSDGQGPRAPILGTAVLAMSPDPNPSQARPSWKSSTNTPSYHEGVTDREVDTWNPDTLGQQLTGHGAAPSLKCQFSHSKTDVHWERVVVVAGGAWRASGRTSWRRR